MSVNFADIMKSIQEKPAQPEADEQSMDEEDMDDDQKYKNWMENMPYLYDHLLVHKMEHPTLSIQWLPDSIESENMVSIKDKLVAGTFHEDDQQNYLNIYSVILPKFKGFVDLDNIPPQNSNSKLENGKHSIKLDRQFLHDGEVNRTQYMPKNSKVIATKSNEGLVNIYKIDQPAFTGPLQKLTGLSSTGFALNWSWINEDRIVSSGTDGIVGLWTSLERPEVQIYHFCKSAVNVSHFLSRISNFTGIMTVL
jgi:histone-binding protein RBBP4